MPVSKEINRYFNEYMRECKYTKVLRPSTLKGYRDVFVNFTNLLPEVQKLSDLHPVCVTNFYERLSIRLGKEVKGSTIYSYHTRLIMFFRWLEEQGHIPEGSVVDKIARPPSPEYNDDRALDETEIAKLITAIVLNNKSSPFMYKRDLMMIHILLYTGIRKRELLNLKVRDIDLIDQSLVVNGNTSKSKRTRRIPMHPTLSYHIDNYLQERKECKNEYLILSSHGDKELSEAGLTYWVSRYKKLSGVHFHLHRCRHTFACNLARSGADVMSIMKLMGHSSLKMTERYLRSIQISESKLHIKNLYS